MITLHEYVEDVRGSDNEAITVLKWALLRCVFTVPALKRRSG